MAQRYFISGAVADGEYTSQAMSIDYSDFQMPLIVFYDAQGAQVTPSGGSVNVTVSPDGVNFFSVDGGVFDAVDAYNEERVAPFYSGLAIYFKVSLDGVTGAESFKATAWLGDADQRIPTETSDRGDRGVPVFIQDQTTPPLDLRFLERIGTFQLALPTVATSRTFTASPSHGITVGKVIELQNSSNFCQAFVLSVAGNVIEVDSVIGDVYPAGVGFPISSDDMRVNGSVTPRIFTLKPDAGQSGDINALQFNIQAANSMDFSSFGSASALARGCLIRIRRPNGAFVNLFNVKANGGFVFRGISNYYQQKAGGGLFSFVAQIAFNGQQNRGVALRLDGDLGEELQFVIQDDLSTIGQSYIGATAFGSGIQG